MAENFSSMPPIAHLQHDVTGNPWVAQLNDQELPLDLTKPKCTVNCPFMLKVEQTYQEMTKINAEKLATLRHLQNQEKEVEKLHKEFKRTQQQHAKEIQREKRKYEKIQIQLKEMKEYCETKLEKEIRKEKIKLHREVEELKQRNANMIAGKKNI